MIKIDEYYSPDFPIHRSIHLNEIEEVNIPSFIPDIALKNCNRLILSIVLKRDISVCLERGISANGNTSEHISFFTPLIWNALINIDDWEEEKKNIRLMLRYPIDCNHIGLCGFNLYHFYIAQALFIETSMHKLEWWVRLPMVSVSTHMIDMTRRYPLTIRSPREFILAHPSPFTTRIMHLLIAAGLDVGDYPIPSVHDVLKSPGSPLLDRLSKQWDGRFDLMARDAMAHIREIHNERKLLFSSSAIKKLTTPQMNEWYEIPATHFLWFSSQTLPGTIFLFHASYMDTIIKTHIFPFTRETISPAQIREWIDVISIHWYPREEFITQNVFEHFPSYTNTDNIPDKCGLEFLNDWLCHFYSYSHILLLMDYRYRPECMYEYLCNELSYVSIFQTFRYLKKITTWHDAFFWGIYDVLDHGFFLSQRLEELIARIELFWSIQNKLKQPFHTRFPLHQEFADQYDLFIQRFKHQYDYSSFQIYIFLKQLSVRYYHNE